MIAHDDDTQLATLLAKGDARACRAFLDAHQTAVRDYLTRAVRRSDVDDLVQVVFMRAVQKIATYRGEASLRSWLLSIARWASHNQWREYRRRRSLLEALTSRPIVTRQSAPHQLEARADLDRALALVDDEADRDALAHLAAGYTVREIESASGRPYQTLARRIRRAQAIVRGAEG